MKIPTITAVIRRRVLLSYRVDPEVVVSIQSAYFDDRDIFPEGAITFDHALLMRDIPHDWITQAAMEVNS